MSKKELVERLDTNHRVAQEMCLYDLLECESEDAFEDEKNCTIECLRIEVYHIKNLIDALEGLEYEEVAE